MSIKNKYNLLITNELFNNYCNQLINGTYKLLPIFEQQNQEQYLKYINNFFIEVLGIYNLFPGNVNLLKLINILNGLIINGNIEHDRLKSAVFNSISIINKIKEEMLFNDT